MSFTAQVNLVFIAAPSDVASERRIVRELVQEWNDLHALASEAVLLPID